MFIKETMIRGNSRFEDIDDREYDVEEVPMKFAGIREAMRGTNGANSYYEEKEVDDKLLSSQFVKHKANQKIEVITNSKALKGDSDQIVDFLNLQRQARANYVRDVFSYSPQFLDRNF